MIKRKRKGPDSSTSNPYLQGVKGIKLFLWLCLGLLPLISEARTSRFEHNSKLAPSDYLLGSHGAQRDPVYDNYRTIDLGVDLAIGADCGRINFTSSLRSALQNILDSKYLGSMGKDIIASSPLLLTCYFSPTWCAILKHSRLSANFLAQMRLDQCSLIDKYTDSRVEDFYEERQKCVRKNIQSSGGDLERAMESCQNHWDADLASWAGGSQGKARENRLIESSAKWAGMDTETARGAVNLVKALVGDTVITRGKVSVDYGPRRVQITPRTHLMGIERATYSKLCDTIMGKLEGSQRPVEKVVSRQELLDLSGEGNGLLLDHQTIRSLYYLPKQKRDLACRKIADALSMTIFSMDMNRSLDLLTAVSQNPNLPDNRRAEADQKRKALKDQIELTVTLNHQKNTPLNEVLAQVNAEGVQYQGELTKRRMGVDEGIHLERRTQAQILDCADGILCE